MMGQKTEDTNRRRGSGRQKSEYGQRTEHRRQVLEIRQRPGGGSVLCLLFCLLCPVLCVLSSAFAEKIYIDVTSPGARKLPIAVQNFTGGREVSEIVTEDLSFTGLFDCIAEAAQLEKNEEPFSQNSWRGLGVELVVKGVIGPSKPGALAAVISAYDVSSGREVFKKEYSASSDLKRLLSHSISNDIYKILTGHQGVFRTKTAFVGEKGGSRELYLMDWDGHRMHGLGITGGILLTPRWTTKGTELLYSAERQRQWGIYMLDVNTMKERKIVVLSGLNVAGNFFPDNKEFVFTSSKDGKSDIYVGDVVSLTGRKLISSPWIDISPAVSPDGNHVLFVSNRAGSPQIYMADRDGYGIRRMTFEGSYNTSPVWSPKADRIAFSGMAGGRNQIFVMKPDGTGLMQLTDKGNNEEPSFSPDGRYIAFTSDRDGKKGIYIMRVNGEGQKRVTPKGFKASSPSWAPL